MIMLSGLISHKPFKKKIAEQGDDDKYIHIGYGKYKEKGKEKDGDADTFQKTDNGKYVPFKKDGEGKEDKPEPKKTKIDADPFADKKEPDYDEAKWDIDKWMPDDTDAQQEYYSIIDDDEDSDQQLEDMVDFLETNAESEMLSKYGIHDVEKLAKYLIGDRVSESIVFKLKEEFKQYNFTKKSKNWKKTI